MAPPTGSNLVTALTWNLGIGLQSERHARRQMRAVAEMLPMPRVLVLTEARRALYDVYISQLQAGTGHAWRGVFQSHCATAGWNGATNSCEQQDDECVMILSSFEVSAGDGLLMPYRDAWHSARAAVHAAIDAAGVVVHVFGTHLQAGPGSAVEHARLQSIALLRTWAAGFGTPAIIGGDFNAVPTSQAIASPSVGMASAWEDTWKACGLGGPGTYSAWWPTRKIDYWFADPSARARVISTSVVRRVRLSDHLPLVATFRIGEEEPRSVVV